jgi:hypothetical protein
MHPRPSHRRINGERTLFDASGISLGSADTPALLRLRSEAFSCLKVPLELGSLIGGEP